MTPAILLTKSQITAPNTEPFGTVSNGLGYDRSNSAVWVPIPPYYGDGNTVVVGFDSEYVRRGDSNVILSYQFAADDLRGHRWNHVEIVPEGKRFNLDTLLTGAVRMGLDLGHLDFWPRSVYLVGHFTLADLPGFVDFARNKFQFDSIRRTFVSIQRPAVFRLWDKNRHDHPVRVTLRDSMLLAPAGRQSLAALGGLVGLPKVELDEDQITHMDLLLKENRALFLEYAERDPVICVEHALLMLRLNHEITGEYAIPPTLSSIGVVQLLQLWERSCLDRHAVLGTEMVNDSEWSSRLGRSMKRPREVPVQARQLYESFATECYHGGRNEQFFFGAGREGLWRDYDLCGAYTTAMIMIGVPDWDRLQPTRDLDAFQPDVMGFARVRFEFPAATRFPCLPVRSPFGLVFPLAGESCCCSPEIYLAAKMGAKLQVLDGIIVPASFHVRPFEAFVIDCNKRRKSFEKGSLQELLWKEIGNSLYGKMAQGLMRKRCFDSRSDKYRVLPPSRITNPFFAAYVTSMVRAVLGEILSRLMNDIDVCSVTTDGFLTTADEDDIHAAMQGPLCRLFAQARLRVCGNATILEAKHLIGQPLGWRVRGQATLAALPGQPVVLAKAGIKPPKKMEDKTAQNTWMVDLFLGRHADSKLEIELLRCLPEIHRKGGDLVSKTITRRVSMEYDWKRRPANTSTRPIKGTPHLYFDTVPWGCLEEFLRCRDKWEAFRKCGHGILKTTSDLMDFNDFRLIKAGGLRVPHRKAAVAVAKRMFLRGYVRSRWGLAERAMSYSELAAWLTAAGYPTRKSDVENAARRNAKLVPGLVPRTPEVEAFAAVVLERFPGFAAKMIFL